MRLTVNLKQPLLQVVPIPHDNYLSYYFNIALHVHRKADALQMGGISLESGSCNCSRKVDLLPCTPSTPFGHTQIA
eukprot:1136852-Pelagomonas_calceolata.AAC.9